MKVVLVLLDILKCLSPYFERRNLWTCALTYLDKGWGNNNVNRMKARRNVYRILERKVVRKRKFVRSLRREYIILYYIIL